MNATITKSQVRKPYKSGKSVVYVDCPVTSLVDKEFFDKNKIWELDFKCKTWSAVKQLASKYTSKALHTLFPNDTIRFSAKAGCSCGCSPGYCISHANSLETGRDMWVDIAFDGEVIDEVRFKLAAFETKLQQEIFEYNESVSK